MRPNGGCGVLSPPENEHLWDQAYNIWEAALNDHRTGTAQAMEDAIHLVVKEWRTPLCLMLYTLSIAIAQYHVLPGPPIRLNLLTMLGPISSYSALV